MCYAVFTSRLARHQEMVDDFEPAHLASIDDTTLPAKDMGQTTSSRKRSASTALEERPHKMAKVGEIKDHGREDDTGASDLFMSTAAGSNIEETATASDDVSPSRARAIAHSEAAMSTAGDRNVEKMEAERQLGEASKANKQLKKLLEKSENRRHDLQTDYCNLEVENEELMEENKKLKKAGKGNSVALSRKIEVKVSGEWEEKLQKTQDKHDKEFDKQKAQYEKKLSDREARHKKAIEVKSDALKDKDNKHRDYVKNLRQEQKDALAKYKPEHSDAIKEKNEALKAKDEQIAKLSTRIEKGKKIVEDLRTAVRERDDKIKSLNEQHEVDSYENRRLDRIVNTQSKDKRKLGEEKVRMEQAYSEKLVHEGKRWQVQYDIAEKMKADLVFQQRTNLSLRHRNEGNDKQIEALEVELRGAKEEIEELKTEMELFGGEKSELDDVGEANNDGEIKYLDDWSAPEMERFGGENSELENVEGANNDDEVKYLGDWSAPNPSEQEKEGVIVGAEEEGIAVGAMLLGDWSQADIDS